MNIIRIDNREWVSAHDAAEILSSNAGREINDAYVRRLAGYGAIEKYPLDQRTNVYSLDQLRRYTVQAGPGRRAKPKPKPRRRRGFPS